MPFKMAFFVLGGYNWEQMHRSVNCFKLSKYFVDFLRVASRMVEAKMCCRSIKYRSACKSIKVIHKCDVKYYYQNFGKKIFEYKLLRASLF